MKKILIITVAMALGAAAHAADPAAGKEKSKVCAACHGENGISQAPDFPKLAGQYHDYLVRALSDYKSGARKNAIMAGQVTNLPQQDIADLAAYYSSQHGLATKY
jgi:cytochrome c553